jgi:hypothetical protein
MVDVEAGVQRLEGEALGDARIGDRGDAAAARSGDRMEVHVVLHPAVLVVLQRHLDGVADPHADKGPGHLAAEGPVAVGRAVGEIALALDCLEIHAHGLRRAVADFSRQVAR